MCKNTNECPAGQKCSSGVCTATARGRRAIRLCLGVGLAVAILLASVGHAEEQTPKDSGSKKDLDPIGVKDVKTGRKFRSVCDIDCDEARDAAAAASAECSSARTSCTNARTAEKKSCVNDCNIAQARNAAECTRNDPDPACFIATRSVCAECEAGCNAASYNPSECGSVAGTCATAAAKQKAAAQACKC